ncbi:hypothetical protein SRHO_G00150230 [Serrasalmus rhombeus]
MGCVRRRRSGQLLLCCRPSRSKATAMSWQLFGAEKILKRTIQSRLGEGRERCRREELWKKPLRSPTQPSPVDQHSLASFLPPHLFFVCPAPVLVDRSRASGLATALRFSVAERRHALTLRAPAAWGFSDMNSGCFCWWLMLDASSEDQLERIGARDMRSTSEARAEDHNGCFSGDGEEA